MITSEEASHNGYTERVEILMKLGAKAVSEIVGFGYVECGGAFKSFINSEHHDKVIIGDFNLVGIDITEMYYTIIFIKI